MSYRVELQLPSCCAEKLDLLSEVEGCTPQEMLVRLFMAGVSAWSVLHQATTEDGMQIACDSCTAMLQALMAERWA